MKISVPDKISIIIKTIILDLDLYFTKKQHKRSRRETINNIFIIKNINEIGVSLKA